MFLEIAILVIYVLRNANLVIQDEIRNSIPRIRASWPSIFFIPSLLAKRMRITKFSNDCVIYY